VFGRSARATHDAQIAQVATVSSWLLLGALFFVAGSKEGARAQWNN
jgi:lipid-binding SYLF domain-containing protein